MILRCPCCGNRLFKDFDDMYHCPACKAKFFKTIERNNYAYSQKDTDEESDAWSANPT